MRSGGALLAMLFLAECGVTAGEASLLGVLRSTDGVDFAKPQPVFTLAGKMVDPFVLQMPDGMLYVYYVNRDP